MEQNQTAERVGAQTRDIQEEIIDRASAGFQPLPMLDIVFRRMAAGIASTFKSRAGLIAEVSFDKVSYGSWGDIVSRVDDYGICGIAEARPWNGTLAVVLDSAFLFAALEAQLGGTPQPGTAPKRPISLIERQISRHVINLILADLSVNVSRLTEAKFIIDSMEPTQQMAAIHGANTPCALATVMVTIDACSGTFDVIIPLATLEPARNKLSKMFLGEKLGGDTTWREHIVSNISGSSVSVTARVREMPVPLADILAWEPGTTIDLGIQANQEVALICSGIPVLHGNAGRRENGNIALRITREDDDPDDTVEAQEDAAAMKPAPSQSDNTIGDTA